MAEFRAVQAHGDITEIGTDLFMVTGAFRMGPGVGITRNMFIVRQGKELVLVSAMRLSPEGEAALQKLGKVSHLIRIGGFHGADDPYVVDRYKPTYWAPANLSKIQGVRTLEPGACPIDGATVFLFEKGKTPEAALVLPAEGGTLVTADCFQNWTSFQGCTLLGGLVGRMLGMGPLVIGGPWTKAQGLGVKADFERLVELPFENLFPGHGSVSKGGAREALRSAMKKRFSA
jgi:hypothetical protein